MASAKKVKGEAPETTSAEVSHRMSKIRSKDTRIELILRRALTQNGYRYRKHYKGVIGSPDVAFVSAKVAIFCDSSFWHGRNWKSLRKRLQTNRQFWVDKIKRNRARDRKVNRQLTNEGWIVLRFWEEDITNRLDWCVSKVLRTVDCRRRLSNL